MVCSAAAFKGGLTLTRRTDLYLSDSLSERAETNSAQVLHPPSHPCKAVDREVSIASGVVSPFA